MGGCRDLRTMNGIINLFKDYMILSSYMTSNYIGTGFSS